MAARPAGVAAATLRAPPLLLLLLLLLLLAQARLAAAAAAGSASGEAGSEVAVMLRLREVAYAIGIRQAAVWQGWAPGDPSPHCSWMHVRCNERGRVTKLSMWVWPTLAHGRPVTAAAAADDADDADADAAGSSSTEAAKAAVLSELTQLRELVSLELGHMLEPLPAGCIPASWCQPGAFPRLAKLALAARCLPGPLPAMQPGALPSLAVLSLAIFSPLPPHGLPPSWGASPAVLPSLRDMHLSLSPAPVVRLPRQWAGGFPSLEVLRIDVLGIPSRKAPGAPAPWPAAQAPAPAPSSAPACAPPAVAPGQVQSGGCEAGGLPPEWASGFPALAALNLVGLPLGGSLPQAWVDGGLPSVSSLMLGGLSLTGTLPPQLFARHPRLRELWLDDNRLSGSLPAEWSKAQLLQLDLARNSLTGPAFPPAWLAAGALPALAALRLSGNPGLTGTLPAALTWPALRGLEVQGTGVSGSVPDSWCQAPFAEMLFQQWVHFGVDGAGPPLPPCALELVPQLDWGGVANGSGGALGGAAGSHGEAGQMVLVICLATLVPLAVVAAAGAAGRALWRRRLRRTQQQRRERDRESLLRRGWAGEGGGGGGAAAAAAAGGGGAGPGGSTGRWARLAALVRTTLGSRSGGIEMLPPGALPSSLVHQLGARRQRSGGGAAPVGHTVSAASSRGSAEAAEAAVPGSGGAAADARRLLLPGGAGSGGGAEVESGQRAHSTHSVHSTRSMPSAPPSKPASEALGGSGLR